MTSPRLVRLVVPACASFLALALAAVPARLAQADDVSPFKDWKEVQKKGVANAKERAQFWTEKGVTSGKDSLWVAKMWNYAGEYAKAVPLFEGYLKVEGMLPDNREAAYQSLIDAFSKMKQYDKVPGIAAKYRADMPNGKLVAESFDNEGRAERLLGHEDKAMAAFGEAAERKFRFGVIDAADIHLANGKVAEAKALVATAIDKFLGDKKDDEKEKAKIKNFFDYLEILDAVGQPVPTFEKAASVGKTPAPTMWKGKPTVLIYWNMQTNGADRKLEWLEVMRRQWGDKANFVGLSTYNHYNPQTSKVVAEMTEDEERDWYGKFILDSQRKTPPCIVVPKDVIEGAKQKVDNQMTVIDADWKLRYARLDNKPYDFASVGLLLEKLTGAKAGEEKEPPPSESPDAPKDKDKDKGGELPPLPEEK